MYFYPRPPRGGRPRCFFVFAQSFVISIHALREEGDAEDAQGTSPLKYFYPRPPRGGRRLVFYRGQRNRIISIHALREEGDRYGRPESGIRRISIHALREEGDTIPQIEINGESDFYPRPPRGGRHRRRRKKTKQKYFYPRPPRGGRHSVLDLR